MITNNNMLSEKKKKNDFLFIKLLLMALRGVSDKIQDANCGIFLSLMEVISQYNPILLNHVKHIIESNKPTVSYFSHEIQNEIICVMGQQAIKTIIE